MTLSRKITPGHVVCGVVGTVAEAVALARLHRPDIAILDMQLIGDERRCDIADQLVESDDLGHMGILYVSGEAARRHPTVRVGHACLAKPYTLVTLNEALEIVRDIACEGATSRLLPRGLRLLSPAETLPQPAA